MCVSLKEQLLFTMRTFVVLLSIAFFCLSAVEARLTVKEGGIYSGVSIAIQEQKQPEDCSSFVRRLEVRNL